MRRPPRLILAGLALVLATSACGGSDPDPAGPLGVAENGTEATADHRVGDRSELDGQGEPESDGVTAVDPADYEALAFSADALGGGRIEGLDHAGGDVVLWMWAPWCPVCNREAPDVAEAFAGYRDRVTFIGIPGRDDTDAMQTFVEEHGLEGMLQAVDTDGALWAKYGVSYQPAWVLIDDDGTSRIVPGALGDRLAEELDALVAS